MPIIYCAKRTGLIQMTTPTYKAIYQEGYGILTIGTDETEVTKEAKSFVNDPLKWGELITVSQKVYDQYWNYGKNLNIAKDTDGVYKMCESGWNGPTFLE